MKQLYGRCMRQNIRDTILFVFDRSMRSANNESSRAKNMFNADLFPDVLLENDTVLLENNTPVPRNKQAFLGNMHNGHHLINVLSAHQGQSGVIDATCECDADIVIFLNGFDILRQDEASGHPRPTPICYECNTHRIIETKQHMIIASDALQQAVILCRCLNE